MFTRSQDIENESKLIKFLEGKSSTDCAKFKLQKMYCFTTLVSHQWCDLFSSTTAQLYATHRKRE